MSWEAAGWAMEAAGVKTSAERLVLIVLADYADPERDLCWPLLEKLCETCLMSERAMVRCLNALEAAGLITCLRKESANQAGLYRINRKAAPGSGDRSP